MRISLLLQREPFGSILERTLERYLSNRFATPVSVSWHDQPGFRSDGEAPWYCNIYLNAIFPARSNAEDFEPLRREFSHSTTWWKRPFQRAYVGAAFAPLLKRVFAQSWLQITPHLPETENWLIVSGNHKIRILNRRAGRAITLLKDGFDDGFFHSELETRRAAEAAGVRVPPLGSVDAHSGWFEEQYVLGTPLNRLPNAATAAWALNDTLSTLQPLYQASECQQPLNIYVKELAARAETLIAQNGLLAPDQRQGLQVIVWKCVQRLERWQNDSISLCLCHGDFQPANLLLDGDTTWLIDWEYARRCQSGYDALVYALGARHPRGLSGRLKDFVADPAQSLQLSHVPTRWEDLWGTADQRIRSAWIFLLEELVLHLHENANPLFFCLGQGLLDLKVEAQACLGMKEFTLD